MRRYEQYKPSSLDWLADVPSHWQVVANRALFRERQEAGEDGLPVLSVSLHTGVSDDEQNEEENARTRTRMADRTSYKRVRPGDVAYNMMRAWQGAIGAVRTDGLVSPAYVVAAPTDALNPAYFEYLYRTDWLIGEMNRASKGITDFRKRLYWQEFKQLSTVVPPREEQDRIVAFLDQKTAEVDAAIAKKERLIGLLHEQMDIVINQLVRVGLNPAASLKDSCTPWLGPIPSHWRPSRLKFLFSGMEQGWSPQCFNFEAPEGTWGVLKVGCVNGAVFNERENKQLPPSERPTPALQVRVGDILISRANSLELVGSAAFVNQCKGKLLLCDKLYRVHAREDQVLSEYLVLMLRTKTARQWIENGANGASPSMQNIGQDVIKNLLVAVPPLDEQRQILAQVESAREKIGLLENRTKSEIGAMAEMRRILISDAVVGKIKI